MLSINKEKSTFLNDCDSLADINEKKVYKCYKYYFTDALKNEVCKVVISFNGINEFVYYYKKNKVVNIKHQRLLKGKMQYVWSIYILNDKEVYIKRIKKEKWIRANEVENAYNLLGLAIDYARKNK